MSKFLIQTVVILTVITLLHLITAYFCASGKIDNFYLRFTSPKQQSLVTGTSRSAQGIVPTVINLRLKKNPKLYNYSFTVLHSRYGMPYYESIKRKLDMSATGGLFIIGVDPWSISGDEESENLFPEKETIPFIIKNPNRPINLEYLVKSYFYGWGHMAIENMDNDTHTIVHKDGWLENLLDPDSAYSRRKTQEKLETYKLYAKSRVLVPERLFYLDKLISLFDQHGKVFLVRIPISQKFSELEKEFMPHFDSLIEHLADNHQVKYFNFIQRHDYEFNDGNHLNRHSSRRFSIQLADSLATFID